MMKIPENINQVVVTGGCGAIGSRLVNTILGTTKATITVLDDLSSGYLWLIPKSERIRVVNGDVCEIDRLIGKIERPTVFHLAAFFANQNSVDHPEDDLHTNGLGTLSVLRWAQRNSAERVVYASAGCSIAGHGVDAPIQEDMPVSLFLDTPYQITKALGEFYCNYFNEKVSTVRCRFFNSYGPGEIPGFYRNVIPNFIWWALHNKPLPITGTGNETRDFIFVDDLVDGLIRAAFTPEAHGIACNLGTGIQTKIGYLAEQVIKLTDSKSEIRYTERRAWDHSVRRQADISRARSVLGLDPRVQLEEGLKLSIAWFRENMEQIKSCLKEDI